MKYQIPNIVNNPEITYTQVKFADIAEFEISTVPLSALSLFRLLCILSNLPNVQTICNSQLNPELRPNSGNKYLNILSARSKSVISYLFTENVHLLRVSEGPRLIKCQIYSGRLDFLNADTGAINVVGSRSLAFSPGNR